jgi:hypothetical protein
MFLKRLFSRSGWRHPLTRSFPAAVPGQGFSQSFPTNNHEPMKKNYLKRILSTGLALLAGTALSPAQTSGVWTNNASGVWSGATNWLNGAVADGAGATADFSQANLTANRTVTLDANHNLGNLIFGNATSGYNWLLAGGGGAVNLTNAAAGPAFAVTNIAVITASLTGSLGLAKIVMAGPPRLARARCS